MSTAFLLRFQEECVEGDARGMTRGTRTETKTQKEQPDHMFAAPSAGTHTFTEVGREVADIDNSASRPFHVFP